MYSTVFAFLLRPAIGSRAPTRSIRACLEPSSCAVREDEGLLSSSPRDRDGEPESQVQPPCRKGSMWPSPCNLVDGTSGGRRLPQRSLRDSQRHGMVGLVHIGC